MYSLTNIEQIFTSIDKSLQNIEKAINTSNNSAKFDEIFSIIFGAGIGLVISALSFFAKYIYDKKKLSNACCAKIKTLSDYLIHYYKDSKLEDSLNVFFDISACCHQMGLFNKLGKCNKSYKSFIRAQTLLFQDIDSKSTTSEFIKVFKEFLDQIK